MENKQSSIEWLEEQIKDIFYVAEASEMTKNFKSVYEQAKEIHKDEIESAYFKGYADNMNDEGDFEEYYNKEFGGSK